MNIFFSPSKWFLGCIGLFCFSFINEIQGTDTSDKEDENASKFRQVGQLLEELRVNTGQGSPYPSTISSTSDDKSDDDKPEPFIKPFLGAGHSTFTVNTETDMESGVKDSEDSTFEHDTSSTDSYLQRHLEKKRKRMQKNGRTDTSSDSDSSSHKETNPISSQERGKTPIKIKSKRLTSEELENQQLQEMVIERKNKNKKEKRNEKKEKKRLAGLHDQFLPNDIFQVSSDTYLKTALSQYTLIETDDSSSLYQDDPGQFMKYMDQGLFCYSCSKKVLTCKILSGIAGLLVSTPVTGKVLWSIGTAFNIPQGDVITYVLIAEIMAIMTPVLARGGYERGGIIAAHLLGEECFTTDIQPDMKNRPHIIGINASHKLHKAVSFIGGCAWAGNYAYTTWLAYHENYPALAWVFSPVIFSVFLERYWDIGAIRGTNFTHAQFSYDNEATQRKRHYLYRQNMEFLKIVTKNNKFANTIYDIIRIALGKVPDEKNSRRKFYFLTSALFLKGALREEIKSNVYKDSETSNDSSEESSSERYIPDAKAMVKGMLFKGGSGILEKTSSVKQRYRTKLQGSRKEITKLKKEKIKALSFSGMASTEKPSSKEAFLGYLGDLGSGAGWFGRVAGMEWLLEDMLVNIARVDPAVASPIAWTCASLQLPLLTLMEYYSLQSYMKSYVNTFSVEHLVQMTYLRKVSIQRGYLKRLGDEV